MPVNGFNIGLDYSFGLYDANTGELVTLGDVQNVKETALYKDLKDEPYNARPKFGHVDDGHKITFTITRTGSQLEDLQITLNNSLNNGQVMKPGYLNKTVTNPDGTVKRYQYTGCDFKLVERAEVARDKVVQQTVECMATDFVPLN